MEQFLIVVKKLTNYHDRGVWIRLVLKYQSVSKYDTHGCSLLPIFMTLYRIKQDLKVYRCLAFLLKDKATELKTYLKSWRAKG